MGSCSCAPVQEVCTKGAFPRHRHWSNYPEDWPLGVFPLLRFHFVFLLGVLSTIACLQNLCALAAKLDSKIRKMKPARTTAVRRREYGIVYRTTKNVAEMNPKEEHLRVGVKESKGWKQRNIEKAGQLSRLLPKIKKAIERSLE
jgi:hypothetical protein